MPLTRVPGQAFDGLADPIMMWPAGQHACSGGPSRPVLILILLGSLLSLVPVACASPPDSMWIEGSGDEN